MKRPFLLASCMVLLSACLLCAASLRAKQKVAPPPKSEYARSIRPLLRQFCLGCHSTAKKQGELDLEQFTTPGKGPHSTQAWLKAAEMLDNGEMPPKGAKQPSPQQRQVLRGWIKRYLDAEALANAGDPGPVVLRRLNNAEYTYTVRDLTGLDISPAREFPSDSASGEGFTNTGSSLVMSPSLLTKYLDAGKEIAKHAELLPDGFRFSPSTTRADWTNSLLAQIRSFYAQYSGSDGASQVNLQGIVFNTNDGGRLPIERYVKATLIERDALRTRAKTIAEIAKAHSLNAKYLGLLWAALTDSKPSLLLDRLREQWLAAKPTDTSALAADIVRWQQTLFKFSTVGHIGRAGGPTAWQEPVMPIVPRLDVRLKAPVPPGQREATLYLTARGSSSAVVWQNPRLTAPGRPDLPLRDVRAFVGEMSSTRDTLFRSTAGALNAIASAGAASTNLDTQALAKRHSVDANALEAWLEYLGIRGGSALKLDHFTGRQTGLSNYGFVNGWGAAQQLPSVVANSSDEHVRIPGNLKPHGVCVHPSPTVAACVGWQSPVTGILTLEGAVTHAHPECGNGVTWQVEVRRGSTRRRVASGLSQGGKPVIIEPISSLAVQAGDMISLIVGPRNGDHGCDLTDLELVLKSSGRNARTWSLTKDVSPNIMEGNPHADQFGNPGVWHFYAEPVTGGTDGAIIPSGSLLARWQSATTGDEKRALAASLQNLLVSGPSAGADEKQPDVVLYRELSSLGGPLLARTWSKRTTASEKPTGSSGVGLDPSAFGKRPDGASAAPTDLWVKAPSTIAMRLPAELLAGMEFVTTGMLDQAAPSDVAVQMTVLTTKPSDSDTLTPGAPVLAAEGSPARKRIEAGFDEFRRLFPAALCYTKIVPVDEVVTLTLFYREDDALQRLMLSDEAKKRLDRLWEELHYVSQDALTLVSAYEQIVEFATQDRPDMVIALKPMRKPINDRAKAFRSSMVAAEPAQVGALVAFAARAYRRPLAAAESAELRALYKRLRGQELPHEEAFRLTLARIFVSPTFLYRLESAPVGASASTVSNWELANRLSYFLWSSQPDETLRAAAAEGNLQKPEMLAAQARRMMQDGRVKRLATEFACQWLHIYDFDTLDEKSERHFPEFAALRGDMYEESIRFFMDLFQHGGSVLSVFDADHTFVNERLAKFYGIPGISGEVWRRVTGMRQRGRGGILGLATTLAKQSGASRTSPILRGNWVSEVLLGERLPRPPKDVPILPEDETATDGLTVRQLVAKHTSDPKCSGCHRKIDPFGFSLEGFDAVGRQRTTDLANRRVDTRTTLPDGRAIDGLPGLRKYLVETRRNAIVRQFCKKLLGYALGRATQLSDEPLLTDIRSRLAKTNYRLTTAIEMIVQSRQFREKRGAAGSAELARR